MREEMFEEYDQQRSSRVGKIKKSSYARSLRHSQLISRAPQIGKSSAVCSTHCVKTSKYR